MALKIPRYEALVRYSVALEATLGKFTRQYKFVIFIDGPMEVLRRIDYVQYHLPSNFAKQTITKGNWSNKFSYKSFTYSSFEFEVTIMPKNRSLTDPGYSGSYFVDVERPDENGFPIPIP